jgi:hypothetical protein
MDMKSISVQQGKASEGIVSSSSLAQEVRETWIVAYPHGGVFVIFDREEDAMLEATLCHGMCYRR